VRAFPRVDSWQRGVLKDPGHAEMLEKPARTLVELDRFTAATVVAKQLMIQPGWSARANLLLGHLYEMMNVPEQKAIAKESSPIPHSIFKDNYIFIMQDMRTGGRQAEGGPRP
jgi:hypothetical protein